MNRNEDKKRRKAMTWTVLLYIIGIMVISVVLSFIIVSLLLHFRVINMESSGERNQHTMLLITTAIELLTGFIVINLSGRMLLNYINKFINRMNHLASGDFKVRFQTQEYSDVIPPSVRLKRVLIIWRRN